VSKVSSFWFARVWTLIRTFFTGEWRKDMNQCVELKTNMEISSGRQRDNFEKCVGLRIARGEADVLLAEIVLQEAHEALGAELAFGCTSEHAALRVMSASRN
jgi:hypothetical protein